MMMGKEAFGIDARDREKPTASVDHRWLFAGLDAHRISGQTLDGAGGSRDVCAFGPLGGGGRGSPDAAAELMFVCWSQVVFREAPRLVTWGHRAGIVELPENVKPTTLTSLFGDHNGMLGAVDADGRLLLVDSSPAGTSSPPCLRLISTTHSRRLIAVTIAGNDRVAVCIDQEQDAGLFHVLEFFDMVQFTAWYKQVAQHEVQPLTNHKIPGKLKQLTSNAAIFISLTQHGDVYTWGDARYKSLGRSISGADGTPAEQPELVDSLGGIKVVKVSADGWTFAALSEDKDVYLLNASAPGKKPILSDAQTGEMVLVDVPDAQGNPYDFEDVAVGSGHVVILSVDGRVFVAGDNRSGQLGWGSVEHVHAWTAVHTDCSAIAAGSKMSLLKASV